MDKHYKKTQYSDDPGYALHHTIGSDAHDSTVDHLHITPNYMIIYFLRGRGNIRIEGNHYDLLPGDLIFVDPSELFHCSIEQREYHERIVLHVSEQFVRNFTYNAYPLLDFFRNRPKGVGNYIASTSVQTSGLDRILSRLLSLQNNNDPVNTLLRICTVVEILAVIKQITTVYDASPVSAVSRGKPIADILRYLNQHFREDISIASVATYFGIAESYLSHLFKEETGIPLWNYVVLRRLQYANSLLDDGCSAEDACFRSGFSNYSNFYRLYKKNTGITPMQYKKR